MRKIIMSALVALAIPASASAADFKPTTGVVCQPRGVNASAGWAIEYSKDFTSAIKFVKLNDGGVRLGKNWCIEYTDGSPVRFLKHKFGRTL